MKAAGQGNISVSKEEDVALSETKSLIDRVFKGSVNMMMSALVRSDELSKMKLVSCQGYIEEGR